MKTMRGGVATPFEDPLTRFKHEILMQDHEQLNKETDFIRKKLEMTRQKRLILMAEVRFLRRKRKYFSLNQTSTVGKEPKPVMSENSKVMIKSNAKKKKQTGKEASLRSLVPRFDLNKKSKMICNERKSIPNGVLDLAQWPMMINNGSEPLRNPMPLPDLNQKDPIDIGNQKTSSRFPAFDLNQISREEEELQMNGEQIEMEDSKNSSLKTGNDELQNDLKLTLCRNIKKGLKRAGQRKVSWQDPLALRV